MTSSEGRPAPDVPAVEAEVPATPPPQGTPEAGPVPQSDGGQPPRSDVPRIERTDAATAATLDADTDADSDAPSSAPDANMNEPERCSDAGSVCDDSETLASCREGTWQRTACIHGCASHAWGATCLPAADLAVVSGHLRYAARTVADGRTGWSQTVSSRPALGVAVVSQHGDRIVDVVYTEADGRFEVATVAPTTPEDSLTFALLGVDADAQSLYAVADPGFEPSNQLHHAGDVAPDASLWAWNLPVREVAPDDPVVVGEELGSGALQLFSVLHSVYAALDHRPQGASPPRTVVWMGLGTRWDCGACTAASPAELAGDVYEQQVWLDGSGDAGYWSDAVTVHELGHVWMSAYGHARTERGPHYVGVPTHPGLAWAEGWATFFSCMHRDSSLYYDKQGGTFFWFDLASRSYGLDDLSWQRAQAHLGLTQLMDENEVAALLLENHRRGIPGVTFLDAIASPRMRTPPFERGYTRREWQDALDPDDFVSTDESLPYLADYLDALRCAGAVSAEELDAVTEPGEHYPYPSQEPRCR